MDRSNRDDTLLDWPGAPSDFQTHGPGFLARTYLVDRELRRLRPDRILDIGCGRGNVTAIAARHARQVIATDVAHDAVAATRAVLKEHPNGQTFVADILRGDWGDYASERETRFDCVLLSEVLEHLDDDVAALVTCRELLTDHGCLLITVPADPALWTRWDDLAGHRRRYTRQELVSKLEATGFRVRQLTNWGFPLTRWLVRRGARMRARRLDERHAGGEFPAALRRILPLASIAFKIAARVEPLLSFLDRGAGYVVVAERALPDDSGSASRYGLTSGMVQRLAPQDDRRDTEVSLSHGVLDRESRLRMARKIVAVLHDFGDGLSERSVLDVGTGAGVIAAYLAERARSVVAVDVVDARLDTSVPFFLISDEDLPFRAQSFDIVLSNHILDHVRDQEKHLREIHRVLLKGGVCYLAVFNRYTLLEPHYKLPFLSWLPPSGQNLYLKMAKGRHYNVWPITYRKLTLCASTVGFEIRDASLDLVKHPERYAMANGLGARGIALLPRWLLGLMRPVLPSFVLVLRKRAS